jgi:hypothetical protein
MKGTVDKCDHQCELAQVKMTKVGGENVSVDALFEGLGEEMRASFQQDPARSDSDCQMYEGADVARRPAANAAPKLPSNQIHSTLPLSPR